MADELQLLGIDAGQNESLPGYMKTEDVKESMHYSNNNEQQATTQFERLVRGGYFSSETALGDWLSFLA